MKDYKLILGDSAIELESIDSNSIDLVITSPPYDDMRDYHGYIFNFEKIANELKRIIKDGSIIVWIVGDQTKNFCESLSSFKQAIYFHSLGLNLLDTMIYKKIGGPSPYPGLMRYVGCFEYMFIFSKGKPKVFNPLKDRKNKYFGITTSGTQRQKDGSLKPIKDYIIPEFTMRTNIWEYSVGHNKDTKDQLALSHPARFPEDLVKDHILSWSNPGDLILDPFLGSGTTGKIAIDLDRKFIGIEISKKYYDISKNRLDSFDILKDYF